MNRHDADSSIDRHTAAISYEYERILDLIERIEDCAKSVYAKLPDRTVPGNSQALGFAKQIEADAQELQSHLTARAYEIGGETA